MRVGIVGAEGAKFTASGRVEAEEHIREILKDATEVVSGACHLGGVDIWAAQIGASLGIKVTEFPPKTLSWETGYKPRNLLIARNSDIVYCIVVRRFPDNYTGMRFPFCYHCKVDGHIKSGGCWTMKEAMRLGKPGKLIVVENKE